MRPLTDDQRQLVVDNKSLVFSVVYRMIRTGQLFPSMYEDAISEGMLGLMRAAVFFDPSRGYKFSTLATMSIRRQIINYIRTEYNQKKYHSVSLDEPSRGRAGETIGNELLAQDDVEKDALNKLNELVELISKDHPKAKYIDMLVENANGRTMIDIAQEHGVSKQYIQARISDARRLLRNKLDRNDWL